MYRFILMISIVSAFLVASIAAQESHETQENQGQTTQIRTVIALKNGLTLEPEKATISGEKITLFFRNGTTQVYSKKAVDFDESSGITEAPTKKKISKKGGLSGAAGTIKLTKSTTDAEGKIVIIGEGETSLPDANAATASTEKEKSAKVSDPSDELRRSAANLSSSWGQYQSLKGEFSRNCIGDRAFWSGGKQYFGPANQTLECRSAAKRARNRISQSRSQYNTIVNEARQKSVLPGTLREVLSNYGLTNLVKTLSSEEEYLDTTMKPNGKRYIYD